LLKLNRFGLACWSFEIFSWSLIDYRGDRLLSIVLEIPLHSIGGSLLAAFLALFSLVFVVVLAAVLKRGGKSLV
jgi:hypothetical protein